jgi:hypothetical protein
MARSVGAPRLLTHGTREPHARGARRDAATGTPVRALGRGDTRQSPPRGAVLLRPSPPRYLPTRTRSGVDRRLALTGSATSQRRAWRSSALLTGTCATCRAKPPTPVLQVC